MENLGFETNQKEEQLDSKELYEANIVMTKIDDLLTTDVRLKRIGAFVLDALFTFGAFVVIVMIIASVVLLILKNGGNRETTEDLLTTMISISSMVIPLGLLFRDFALKGRSLGKRIFGLIVIDSNDFNPARKGMLLLRNVLYLFVQLEGIVLLICGRTIGDSIANTVVISKKQWQELKNSSTDTVVSEINAYRNPKAETKKAIGIIAVICLGFVLFSGLIFGTVMLSLNRGKETEQYAVAYNYIIESGVLEKNGLNEENLKLNSYSTQTSLNSGKSYAELGFWVDGVKILVICHNEGEEWYVCENCTFAGEKVCPQF